MSFYLKGKVVAAEFFRRLSAHEQLRLALQGALIVLAVFLAYLPVWHCGFIWDDNHYVTRNATLHDLDGLRRIWFVLGAVPQYYPLVHTSFWLEYHLWGLNPAGYHVVNVLLHATAAILLGLCCRRLQIPGAWLVAVIFALHPVCVESVAWITERKNVLSAVSYFAAALAYLHFAPPDAADASNRRPWRYYWAALALFVAALSSKTVTCSLPAALLLVCWWKKGYVRRGDILPLVPFFVTGAGLGLLTAWIEKYHAGAQGAAWSLTFGERCLIAGRAVWFYADKLVWPAQLTFIYPRWNIATDVWWQWLFPLAAVGVLAGLWLARRRIGRGPLVAVLFFAGTLGPALGFANVYPMRYSFVADHFQYLAAVGLMALGAAGLSRLPRVVPILLAVVLGVLTWRQTGIYRNLETLWRDTLAKNPECWMACSNLGICLENEGHPGEAMELYRRAVQINPNSYEALNNLGLALAKQGQLVDAIKDYRQSIQINPNFPEALNNLGYALAQQGQLEEAIKDYHQALHLNPDSPETLNNLGNALAQQGQLAEAVGNYRQTLRLNPNFPEALNNLGYALAQQGQFDEAIKNYRRALHLNADFPEALNNLGFALAGHGRLDEAIGNYHRAIQFKPDFTDALNNLGNALAAQGHFEEAVGNYRQAIQIDPHSADALNNLGNALAARGRFAEAIESYHRLIQINTNSPETLDNLGNALAAQGRFDEAVESYRRAIQIKPDSPEALNNLGYAFAQQGRFAEAIESYQRALKIKPDFCQALNNLGYAYTRQGQLEAAIGNYRLAIQINPNYSEALNNLGYALAQQGQFDEAIKNYRRALQINPIYYQALNNLGFALAQQGQLEAAIGDYRQALQINPNFPRALNNLSWVLATGSRDELRDGAEAVQLAKRACELTQYQEPLFLRTLAAAEAEAGHFSEAVTTAENAAQLATQAGLADWAVKNQPLLELYRAGKPYHEAAQSKPQAGW